MPNIYETNDAAAGTSTAYTLGIGQTAQGVLASNGDHDWYRVTLTAGQTYSFAMVGTGTAGVRDSYLRLYGSDGVSLLAENDDGLPNNNSVFTYVATTSGTYYLDAGAFNSAGSGQYGVSAAVGTRATVDVQMGAGIIDAVGGNTEYSWSATPGTPATVTVGFRQTDDGAELNFSRFSTQQMASVQAILQYYSDVCGLTFKTVNPGGYTDNAAILLSNYNSNDGSGGYAYYPGSTSAGAVAGDVHINLAGGNSKTSQPTGSYSFYTLMHELGHTVGLTHPGLYNAGAGQVITYQNSAQFTQDTTQYSVMSYFDESNTTTNWSSYPDTLMMLDIYALQQIYGANMATRAGNTTYGFHSNAGGVYDFSSNTSPALCIWDGGGVDTLDCSGYNNSQILNLNPGSFSNVGGLNGNVSVAIGAVIENAVGGNGADQIIGNGANNILTGGGGADTITGGGGRDVTTYSVASSSASLVHNVNGTWSITVGGQTDIVNGVELIQFTDRATSIRETARQDFNADGTSDLLWRNDSGNLVTWTLNDQQLVNSYGGFGWVSTALTVAGTGDFNGDGSADILWRNNQTGAVSTWELNDHQILSQYSGFAQVSTDWQIVAVADFNADGKGDVLWRNINMGGVVTWDLNGHQLLSSNYFGAVSTDWDVAGTGDFNGDGKSDILWLNDDGRVLTWTMNDNQVLNKFGGFGQVSTDWDVAGVGDFNGDGKSDILWRDTATGGVVTWCVNNQQLLSSHQLGQLTTDWFVEGLRDINGDGTSDILWRNSNTGGILMWSMSNDQVVGSFAGPGPVSTDWHMIA